MIRLRPTTVLLAAALACACGSDPPGAPLRAEAPAAASADDPPGARRDLVEMLSEDRAAPRHPGDGGGRAWIEGEARAVVDRPGRWTVVYEAGPEGVAEGGAVYLMASPFWGWSTPQVMDPDDHGYTEVTSDAQGVTLDPVTVDTQLLMVAIGGRRLEPGERIRFVYGAGPAGAGPDRFAERGERLWIAVDADGDGTRRVLDGSPALELLPGEPAQLLLTLPSSARPGERIRLVAAVLDARGNAEIPFEGDVRLEPLPAGLEGPSRLRLTAPDGGHASVELVAREPGTWRVRGSAPGELRAESNPLEVGEGPRVLWGDLHGHSNFSDGTGTPDDYFRYARDVAGLDVAALTDHDHWGVRFLDERPDLWGEIRAQAARFHESGRFVTLLGYEWTSWIHGHRHVLYFADDGLVLSSLDERTDDPRELWAALDGRPALTFAHHSAGGPIPTNWAIPPDPVFEPVTEVASVHGSSEALDSPGVIYSPVPGNFVRDVLDRGYRLGFVGSGDSHDGHPGLTHLAAGQGGLAAILAEERTREAVLDALRARRSYASNGPRIVLRASLAERPMGSTLPHAAVAGGAELRVRVAAPGELHQVELVRSGAVARVFPGEGRRDLDVRERLDDLEPGEYLYVRVVQIGGGAAWSSPFFIE